MIDEAEVPDILSPQNISIMLQKEVAKKNINHTSSAISMNTNKRAKISRYTVAIAACVALALGVTAFVNDNSAGLTVGYTDKDSEVKEAQDYSDVYNVLFDNFVKNGTSFEGVYDTSTGEKIIDNTTDTVTIVNDNNDNKSVSTYNIEPSLADEIASCDILKTNGNNLYYVSGNSVKVVSTDNGKLSLVKEITTENTPVELFIQGNRLFVISNNKVLIPYNVGEQPVSTMAETTTASETTISVPSESETSVEEVAASSDSVNTDEEKTTEQTPVSETTPVTSETVVTTHGADLLSGDEIPVVPTSVTQLNTVVDTYDISDINNISSVCQYKQNGSYVSSKVINGCIYLVTDHSNYQTKPLENQDDLDNYVPCYYVNGEKKYIDPTSIFIPSKVNSTSYMIVSSIDISSSVNLTAIKAVLGNANTAYFTANELYVTGNANTVNNKPTTSVIKFTLDNGLNYSSNAIVEGICPSEYFIDRNADNFAIVTNTVTSNKSFSELFVFNNSLELCGKIALGNKAQSVRFEDNNVYITFNGSDKCSLVSFADPTNPVISDENLPASVCGLKKYNDNTYLGIGTECDENGKETGTKVTLYSKSENGFTEKASASIEGFINKDTVNSSYIDKESLFIDSEGNIGIATTVSDQYGIKNMYKILSYSQEKGLEVKYSLEYKDIKNSDFSFNRAFTSGDQMYILSDGRMISAQVSDLKVIDTLLLQP